MPSLPGRGGGARRRTRRAVGARWSGSQTEFVAGGAALARDLQHGGCHGEALALLGPLEAAAAAKLASAPPAAGAGVAALLGRLK